MTMLLRVVLIVVSVATTWMILRRIRTSKMRIEDSIFWIGFSCMLILFSLFPQIVYLMTDLTGIQTPVNFIFLFIIFVLILRLFRITVKLSQLETRVRDMAMHLALEEKKQEEAGQREQDARRLEAAGQENPGARNAGEGRAECESGEPGNAGCGSTESDNW